jgi:hypothetical protein
MEMENAIWELATAFQATQELDARTSAPTYAVARANAQMGDACASQASLAWIARSKLVAMAMEIARCLAHAFATQGGWASSVGLPCSVQIQLAAAMVPAQMAIVLAQLASPVLYATGHPASVANVLPAVSATEIQAHAFVEVLHVRVKSPL